MPAQRTVLAADDLHTVERVEAPAHGHTWSAAHRSPDWRWILPGSGEIEWRSGAEQLLVDELTAFHLAPGQAYQLRHTRGRSHLVISTVAPPSQAPDGRGWLVQPRALYQLKLAVGALKTEREFRPAAAMQRVLTQSVPLDCTSPAPAVMRARAFIAAQPGAGHRLEELAEVACCSPFHLARLFRRELGTTPHHYRQHLRMAAALARLGDGERDLAGLACDLGFSSQSHFGVVFLREVGTTPGAARNALNIN